MNAEHHLAELAPQDSRLRQALDQLHGEPLAELNRRLRAERGPEPVAALCADLFASGGKRLRALAVLIVAAAERVESEVALRLAETVELTHGATLLHDDVIDEADTRRGRAAARRRWSNTLSVLGGDFLLLRSLDTVQALEVPTLTAAHRRALDALLSAEVAQHRAKVTADVPTAGYLDIAAGKTGALFAFACASPAYYCGDDGAAWELERFGLAFGTAFQAADDVRDILTLDPGKPAGLDLEDGVLSLPLRLAAQADPDLRVQLLACVERPPAPAEHQALLQRIRASQAVADALAIGRLEIDGGLRALARVDLELTPLSTLGRWLVRELDSMVP